MRPVKLAEILRNYEGKWVALNRARTQVLSSGDTPEITLQLAREKSPEKPILTLVPPFDLEFVG